MKKKTLKQIQNDLQNVKKRDINILKGIKGEINISVKKVKLKNKYTRKLKHKNSSFEDRGIKHEI